jgi:hypothetical protein
VEEGEPTREERRASSWRRRVRGEGAVVGLGGEVGRVTEVAVDRGVAGVAGVAGVEVAWAVGAAVEGEAGREADG